MTNYGAWSGFGQALGGGVDAFQRAKQAKAQALAQGQQADLDKRLKEAQIGKLQKEAGVGAAGVGAAGGLTLEQMLKGTPGERLLNPYTRGLAADPDKVAGQLIQMAKEGNLSPVEGAALGRASYAGQAFKQMGESFKKLPKVESAGEMATAFGSRFVPSIIKQRQLPEVAKFDTNKRMLAERALRMATGAAAPDSEKTEYLYNLMPAYGDTHDIAATKAQQMYEWLYGEAESAAFAKEAEGNQAAAQNIRNFMQSGLPSAEEVAGYFAAPAPAMEAPRGGEGSPPMAAPGGKRYTILSVE